jgi:hypothetical protein
VNKPRRSPRFSLVAMTGALACALSCATGCSPSFDHLDFKPQTTPPLSITLASDQVEVPAGIAVDVAPVAMAGDQALDKSIVQITSTDPTVLGIAPVSGKAGSFVIFGVSTGKASVTVTVDGDPKETIPAQVTAQVTAQ